MRFVFINYGWLAMISIREAQQFALQALTASDSASSDVQLLLCHVLQCQAVRLLSAPEQLLSEAQWAAFSQLVERRQHGEPVAYLTGQRGFWSLDLQVNNSTLIPRPDTELLVELALSRLQANMTVVDLGTGTGAIALALATERRDITLLATDYSFAALTLAKQNAQANHITGVQFVHTSWLDAFQPRSMDFIISNPPYIAADDPHIQQGDLRFEPLSALVAERDGLADLQQIVKQARECLKPNGWLLVEHGYQQSQQVQQLFADAGFTQIKAYQDLGRQDRAVMGQLTL